MWKSIRIRVRVRGGGGFAVGEKVGVGGGVGRVVKPEMWRRVVVWVLLVGCLWECGCMGVWG